MNKPPLFVVGTPRSGTTLMAKILGRHPTLFMPGETHFFPDIYSRRKQFGDPPSPDGARKVFERLLGLYERYNEPDDQERTSRLFCEPSTRLALERACSQGYREALDVFMDAQLRDVGKLRWGNNAPRDLFHVDEIRQFYPDAQFIVCVRDVRDFLLSYKGKWRSTREESVERLKQLYHPVVTTVLWKASMRQLRTIRARLSPRNLLVVRYEDLVSDPEQKLKEVCSMLGIEFEAAMLDVDSNNSSEQVAEKGIFTASVGRWRGRLSSEEICVAQQLTRRELVELGYDLASVSVNPLKVARYYFEAPLRLSRALKANQEITGPLIPYIARRLVALVK